jgi:hypothetical protein
MSSQLTERLDDRAAGVGDPAEAPVPPADRFFDTVTTAVTLACLVGLMVRMAVHAVQPLSNADTWFHLRIGHELWGPWSLAHPGSLTRFASSPWVPTQWSTEMLMAKVEDWFGLPGVAWLYGLFYLVFVVVVYVVCRRRADPLVAALVTGVVVVGAAGALSARPQVLSLVLLAVTAERWSRAARDGRLPWLLVPLTWVWATVHGLWSAGVLLGFVMCLGIVLDSRGGRKAALRLFAVPALSLVAAALTPVGPRLLFSQIAVSQRAPLITEWAATSFRTPDAFAVAAMTGVLLLVWTRTGRVRWTPLLVLLLACGWAMLVTRMVAFAAVLLAPLLAEALSGLRPARRPAPGAVRAERVTVAAASAVILAGMALVAPHTAAAPGQVPARFAPRLAALPAGSPVLVEDPVGSWIEWRFPRLDPTFDGMLDPYPVRYIERFAAAHDVEHGWQRYVRDSDARVAVLVKGSALTDAMRHRLGWRQVQQDGQWVYLEAPEATR